MAPLSWALLCFQQVSLGVQGRWPRRLSELSSVGYNSLVTSELHGNSHQLIACKTWTAFYEHNVLVNMYLSRAWAGPATRPLLMHTGFVLEAIIFLSLITCHFDLQVFMSHFSLLCDMRLLLHFMRQFLSKDIALAVTLVAQCNTSSVKMKCSLKFWSKGNAEYH